LYVSVNVGSVLCTSASSSLQYSTWAALVVCMLTAVTCPRSSLSIHPYPLPRKGHAKGTDRYRRSISALSSSQTSRSYQDYITYHDTNYIAKMNTDHLNHLHARADFSTCTKALTPFFFSTSCSNLTWLSYS
jgi:hypothetical protein